MTITTKDSILKKWYEYHGQQSFFGYDNLEFKTINHPTPHRFVELCPEFKLKQNKKSLIVNIPVKELNNAEVLGAVEPQSTLKTAHFVLT
jgi:hypothetical protein|tara:strand:- start:53 stop:322 length:270 start_codon:yes stop_codon:yes gene_type:complete